MKYFLVFKTEPFITNMFNNNQYQILGKHEKVILVSDKEKDVKLTEEEIQYILSMACKQKIKGIVDITREIEFLISFKGTQKEKIHQFSWMMRNCFTRALVKNEE